MSSTPLLTHRVLPSQLKGVREDLRAIDSAVKGAGSLEKGDEGAAVLALQHSLRRLGVYAGKMNGAFDGATQSAVDTLQARAGLEQTGVIDSKDAKVLRSHEKRVEDHFEGSPARLGQAGEDIRSVEEKLAAIGIDPGKVDGVFDRDTLAAVHKFRKRAADIPDPGDFIGRTILEGLNQRISRTEQNLKLMGFKRVGDIDGRLNTSGTRALKQFQKEHGLRATGEATYATRRALSHAADSKGRYPDVKPSQFQKGYDVSSHQTDATFRSLLNKKSTRFIGVKATEGTDYTNPSFKSWWSAAGKKLHPGKLDLRIAYHFLTPGNGRAQADYFLKKVGVHGKLAPGTRLALDWEADALNSPGTLHEAAKRIHQVTGQWPLVYTSQSQIGRAKQAVPKAPIWDAHYDPESSDYKYPFVQTGDSPVDQDVFTGSELALRKWAGW